MKRDRFIYVCQEAQSGNDAFVCHPITDEEGMVLNCSREHLAVKTNEGKRRCWDYHECNVMRHPRELFFYR